MAFILQSQEPKPFIVELLGTLTSIIQDLQLHQIHMFYEAVGLMISSEKEPPIREAYLVCFSAQSSIQQSLHVFWRRSF